MGECEGSEGLASMSELDRLYDVAGDRELSVLDELAVRAGLLWRCDAERERSVARLIPDMPCGWMNRPEAERCEGCGADRPGVEGGTQTVQQAERKESAPDG